MPLTKKYQMNENVFTLHQDVIDIQEEVAMQKFSKRIKSKSNFNVTLFAKRMNAQIFLAKVRYMLVSRITWQAMQMLRFVQKVNTTQKINNKELSKESQNYIDKFCETKIIQALKKNIDFIKNKVTRDIHVFLEIFSKLLTMYPEMQRNM